MAEFMTEIPSKIRDKVVDKNWSETFIFEDMPCNHKPNAKEHEKINCLKCQYDKRELWLESELTRIQGTETTNALNPSKAETTYTINKIIVIRGVSDDVIGIQKEWV